jgi:ketosteroid isomerase-like protein
MIRDLFDRSVAAVERGDVEEWKSFYTADVQWQTIEGSPDEGTYSGHAGIQALIETWLGDFDDMRIEALAFDDRGDHALVEVGLSGRGKGSGIETSLSYATVVWVRDGKLSRVKEFPDLDTARDWLAHHG